MIYGGGSGSGGKVVGPVTISGNRFSRESIEMAATTVWPRT